MGYNIMHFQKSCKFEERCLIKYAMMRSDGCENDAMLVYNDGGYDGMVVIMNIRKKENETKEESHQKVVVSCVIQVLNLMLEKKR